MVGFLSKMNNSYTEDHGEATVVGFEVPKSPDSSYNNVYAGNEDEARDPPVVPPRLQDEATAVGVEVSPDSSYNNVYPGNEDEARDPPMVPPHLQHTLLGHPASRDALGIPLPQNVILNHLYIENREAPRSVVALGFTHRFRSKYVTVVLYKPVHRRGNTSI